MESPLPLPGVGRRFRRGGYLLLYTILRAPDESSQEGLAEYIALLPISLKKIPYEPFKGRVLFHTTYSHYFKQNPHMFNALDFLAELTRHLPPKRLQVIRRYGLYASRTKGRCNEMPWVAERAPEDWKAPHPNTPASEELGYEPLAESEEEVDIDARKCAWARLRAKVYEVDPLRLPQVQCRDESDRHHRGS